MTSKTVLTLLGSLLAIEIFSVLLVRWTFSRQHRIFQRHLGDRNFDSLDEIQLEEILNAVAAEYDRTFYRKLDLLVITFHLPALASWGILTRQSTTPPIYYHGATMVFWFGLLFGLNKVIVKFGGA